MTGRADYLNLGNWNAVCFECGRKRKASELKRHWRGYYVCLEHWEPRQTQDFVRSIPDNMTPAWAQPMPTDTFRFICDLVTQQGIADYGTADCARADYNTDARPTCTTDGSSGITGYAVAGCSITSRSR